jgi:hypothetical protein
MACAGGTHISEAMNSSRLLTFARASAASCLTSTGPTSLNTSFAGASAANSCVRRQPCSTRTQIEKGKDRSRAGAGRAQAETSAPDVCGRDTSVPCGRPRSPSAVRRGGRVRRRANARGMEFVCTLRTASFSVRWASRRPRAPTSCWSSAWIFWYVPLATSRRACACAVAISDRAPGRDERAGKGGADAGGGTRTRGAARQGNGRETGAGDA